MDSNFLKHDKRRNTSDKEGLLGRGRLEHCAGILVGRSLRSSRKQLGVRVRLEAGLLGS